MAVDGRIVVESPVAKFANHVPSASIAVSPVPTAPDPDSGAGSDPDPDADPDPDPAVVPEFDPFLLQIWEAQSPIWVFLKLIWISMGTTWNITSETMMDKMWWCNQRLYMWKYSWCHRTRNYTI